MSDEKNVSLKNLRIRQWWIDWYTRDDYYFCAVVEINEDQFQYIERKLENS